MSRSIAQTEASADRRGHALVTLDGRYHVLERIAAGGMGEVFLAQDAVLAREVAIKVLHRSLASDPGFVDRFRREARAAATLNHPNIVAVYDWGAVDGIYYMVMEYVRGRSVRDLLNVDGPLAPAQAAEIVRQTLLALEHAHEKGIVHRDLKPENILLTTDGTVKLTDMGLARAFADAKATHAGAVTGTVQYLAPEQIRGEPADPRSDLYSLGIVTYELLTGRLPFEGETPMAIAYKHLSDTVPPPSGFADVGPDMDAFVAAAVDKDREMRPESATVMRQDLEAIARALPRARSLSAVVQDLPEVVRPEASPAAAVAAVTATIPRTEEAPRRRRGRRFLGVLAIVLLAAAAAWGVWTYADPAHDADPPGGRPVRRRRHGPAPRARVHGEARAGPVRPPGPGRDRPPRRPARRHRAGGGRDRHPRPVPRSPTDRAARRHGVRGGEGADDAGASGIRGRDRARVPRRDRRG